MIVLDPRLGKVVRVVERHHPLVSAKGTREALGQVTVSFRDVTGRKREMATNGKEHRVHT